MVMEMCELKAEGYVREIFSQNHDDTYRSTDCPTNISRTSN